MCIILQTKKYKQTLIKLIRDGKSTTTRSDGGGRGTTNPRKRIVDTDNQGSEILNLKRPKIDLDNDTKSKVILYIVESVYAVLERLNMLSKIMKYKCRSSACEHISGWPHCVEKDG